MFQIEKGVQYTGEHSKRKGLAMNVCNTCISMKAGESFLIPSDKYKEAKPTKGYIQKVIREKFNNSEDYKVSIVEGGIRVWLIK